MIWASCLFFAFFRLSKKYGADAHRVIMCATIQEGQHSYHADDPTKRIDAAHTFEAYEGGVDCRVPGGVKSLGPATRNGDRYTFRGQLFLCEFPSPPVSDRPAAAE